MLKCDHIKTCPQCNKTFTDCLTKLVDKLDQREMIERLLQRALEQNRKTYYDDPLFKDAIALLYGKEST
jgi:hypothetical protein